MAEGARCRERQLADAPRELVRFKAAIADCPKFTAVAGESAELRDEIAAQHVLL